MEGRGICGFTGDNGGQSKEAKFKEASHVQPSCAFLLSVIVSGHEQLTACVCSVDPAQTQLLGPALPLGAI